MATQNVINKSVPLSVANGGTGSATLTAHAVLVAAGAAALTPLTVATNGQALIGSTAADPVFGTLSSTDSSIIFTTGAGLLTFAGRCIQQVNTATSVASTVTTAIPNDDTIPQNTEGTQILSLSITPTSASSILYIYASIPVGGPTGDDGAGGIALFQDSTASAIAARQQTAGGSSSAHDGGQFEIEHMMTAGTTSSTTFAVFVGPSVNTNTYTINGAAGSRKYGGAMHAILYILELG